MEPVREMAGRLLDRARKNPSLVQFYVSKQWLNKFENFAEPGKKFHQIDLVMQYSYMDNNSFYS